MAHTKYGTYYGAAANPWFLNLLPRKNQDVFPLSKSAVQSKPAGITVYNARRAYQATLQSRAYKIEENPGKRLREILLSKLRLKEIFHFDLF